MGADIVTISGDTTSRQTYFRYKSGQILVHFLAEMIINDCWLAEKVNASSSLSEHKSI